MRERIKNLVGNMLISVYPKKAQELTKTGLSRNTGWTRTERYMRDALLEKAKKNKDYESLGEFHSNYWVNSGGEFFSEDETVFNNLEDFFKPKCEFFFDELKVELKNNLNGYNTFVEIGVGNGRVINYLEKKFPEINKLIGIDLSEDLIEKNKVRYKDNSKMEFFASDVTDWVKSHAKSGMIFYTIRGVLEYLTEPNLVLLISELRKIENVMILVNEPLSPDHDFIQNPHSEVFGYEKSFSHNYEKLLRDAGFNIWTSKEKTFDDWRYCYIGARC